MSNITITETCLCGARIELAGYSTVIERQVEKFREAHTVCRSRPQPTESWLLQLPIYGEEE